MRNLTVRLDSREQNAIAAIQSRLMSARSADRPPTKSEAVRFALRAVARMIAKGGKCNGEGQR